MVPSFHSTRTKIRDAIWTVYAEHKSRASTSTVPSLLYNFKNTLHGQLTRRAKETGGLLVLLMYSLFNTTLLNLESVRLERNLYSYRGGHRSKGKVRGKLLTRLNTGSNEPSLVT